MQEYSIDATRYTGDVEMEFLEAFCEVLKNRVPLWYQDSVARFFRDDLRGVFYLSDSEFIEEVVKNIPYRLIDMDGDGLLELAMEVDWGICVLKYNVEEQRVTSYFGPSEGWNLLGSNRFGLHDTGSPCLSQNRYIVWDEQRETVQEFNFQADSMYEVECTVSGSGEINGGGAVSEEEWDILTEDFLAQWRTRYSLRHMRRCLAMLPNIW